MLCVMRENKDNKKKKKYIGKHLFSMENKLENVANASGKCIELVYQKRKQDEK